MSFSLPHSPPASKWGARAAMPTRSPVVSGLPGRKGSEKTDVEGVEPRACGHRFIPQGPVCTVSKSKSWPVMPLASVQRKEHRPGKQETQASVPVPHSTVTRHKPFGTSVSLCIKWDNKTFQGFPGEGWGGVGTKEVITPGKAFRKAQHYHRRGKDMEHVLPLPILCPRHALLADVSTFSLNYIDTSESLLTYIPGSHTKRSELQNKMKPMPVGLQKLRASLLLRREPRRSCWELELAERQR